MSNPTQLYSDQNHKTQLYDVSSSESHGIKVGEQITLKDLSYTILDIISQESGEAIIYQIEDDKKKIFALKMYFEFRNEKDEPNAKALKRILEITDNDILKLYNFGIAENKFQGKYCFELLEMAQGSDLLSVPDFEKKYTANFIEKKVIPQTFKGIQTLHRNKIFHCDLKPQNVFFSDSAQTNLVIGDYGSAKTFELDKGKDSRKTSTVKGTDFYLPPEQARGFISEKNDFYSFGMIVLHLLYPEKISEKTDFKRLNRQKFRQIIENQFQNKPIITFDKKYNRLNHLIAGLTLTNVANRWGAYEVRRWLNGENPEIIYQAGEQNKEIAPIDLGDRIIQTEADLVKFIETDEEWYELLIEDETGRYLFYKWLMSVQHYESKENMNKVIRKYQAYGIDFLKESLLRYFQPYRPIIFQNEVFDFYMAKDFIFESARYFGVLLNYRLSENQLKLYVFKYKLILENFSNTKLKHQLALDLFGGYENAFKKDIKFPKRNFKSWLYQAISLLIPKNKTQYYAYFQEITVTGVQCEMVTDWSKYFEEEGVILEIKYKSAQCFAFPNYQADKVKKNGKTYFSYRNVYKQTVQKIYETNAELKLR